MLNFYNQNIIEVNKIQMNIFTKKISKIDNFTNFIK